MTQFQQGEAAMVITGPWNIGTFEDPAETPVCDSIELQNSHTLKKTGV